MKPPHINRMWLTTPRGSINLEWTQLSEYVEVRVYPRRGCMLRKRLRRYVDDVWPPEQTPEWKSVAEACFPNAAVSSKWRHELAVE